MKEKEMLQKKELVDKYLKKKKYICLFDIYFYNIDEVSLYMRLDYDKNSNTYRINIVNLSSMENKKVESWLNSNLIYPSMVHEFKNIIANNGIVEDYIDNDNINSKVIINSYLTDYEYTKKSFTFKRYIPKCWQFLAEALYILFDAVPRYQYSLFQILLEGLIEPDTNCVFKFDLEKDNIDNLFNKKDIISGKEIFDNKKVRFLEKVNNTYYSVISGKQEHLVSIINNYNNKEVQMSCNCFNQGFCKHIYATLLAIKNKKEKKFFKIAKINNDKNVIDNLKEFNYYLCADIVEDYFVVVNNLEYLLLPILDNKTLAYKIIEDDENKTLEKKLNSYLKKHKIDLKKGV